MTVACCAGASSRRSSISGAHSSVRLCLESDLSRLSQLEALEGRFLRAMRSGSGLSCESEKSREDWLSGHSMLCGNQLPKCVGLQRRRVVGDKAYRNNVQLSERSSMVKRDGCKVKDGAYGCAMVRPGQIGSSESQGRSVKNRRILPDGRRSEAHNRQERAKEHWNHPGMPLPSFATVQAHGSRVCFHTRLNNPGQRRMWLFLSCPSPKRADKF